MQVSTIKWVNYLVMLQCMIALSLFKHGSIPESYMTHYSDQLLNLS